MKERPILMNGVMVRATLDGSKTQTRRIVKPSGLTAERLAGYEFVNVLSPAEARGLTCKQPATTAYAGFKKYPDQLAAYFACPFGTVGDQLWVRETWKTSNMFDELSPSNFPKWYPCKYMANGDARGSWAGYGHPGKTRVSIHMPRWASRIQLEITGVRVERLQDISDADILAEGIDTDRMTEMQDNYDTVFAGTDADGRATLKSMWRDLWISTGGDWDANPWVWVIEFRRVK